METANLPTEKPQEAEEFKVVAKLLLPHAVPLILLPSRDSGPTDVIWNGSGSLIDTGKRKLLITCDHVWERFKKEVRDSNCCIGMVLGTSIAVISDFEVVDSDKMLDLAILDLSDFKFPEESEKRFYKSPKWPPDRAQVGELLVLIGFPGCLRSPDTPRDLISFLTTNITDFVVSVSEQRIALADEEKLRKFFHHLDENPPEKFSLGGMSGCPAFVKRSTGFVFVGILYESPDNSDGIIFISHADFIDDLGRIDWSRVPPF